MQKIPCPCSEEHFRHLVESLKLSDVDIASRLPEGTPKRVRAWRLQFGLSTVGRWNHSQLPALEGTLRSLLVGSMLGDGRLVRRVHATYYTERHCGEQLGYLEWKSRLWGSWARPIREIPDKRGYQQFGFITWARPELNEWQELFYPNHDQGWKRLLPKVVDLVDPLALAIWYLDDGCARWWPDITFGMSNESRQVACAVFEKFSLHPRWHLHRRTTGDFHMEREDTALRFLSIIEPHVPDCMRYKLGGFGFQGAHYRVRQVVTREMLLAGVFMGKPIRRMAQELGVGYSTVSRWLKKFDIEHPRKVGRPKGS